jgi:hypothetical protein
MAADPTRIAAQNENRKNGAARPGPARRREPFHPNKKNATARNRKTGKQESGEAGKRQKGGNAAFFARFPAFRC